MEPIVATSNTAQDTQQSRGWRQLTLLQAVNSVIGQEVLQEEVQQAAGDLSLLLKLRVHPDTHQLDGRSPQFLRPRNGCLQVLPCSCNMVPGF